MSHHSKILAPSALLLLTATAAGASDVFVYGVVGGWTIRTDRARNYDCFAEAEYDGASFVRIGIDGATADTHLIFADPSWGPIEEGQAYRVAVSFGAGKTWSGTATGRSLTNEVAQRGLYFSLDEPDMSRLVESFMLAPAIEITYDDRDALVLSLSGSYRATEALRECQAAMASMRD